MKYLTGLLFLFIFIISCKDEKLIQYLDDQAIIARQDQIATQKKLDSLKALVNEIQNSNSHRPISELNSLYENCKKSVLVIVTFDENNKSKAQGSAFIIGADGIGISNYHVFENSERAIALDFEGNEYTITEYLNYDKDLDYIYFRISNVNLPILSIASFLPHVGDQCFAIGTPHGLDQTLSSGIISAYRRNEDLVQTSAEITHGSSGGPLFNSIGQVIGITSSGIGEANLNFAVNVLKLPKPYLSEISTINTEIVSNDIKSLALNYYNNLFENNWQLLEAQYSSTIKEFSNKQNVSRSFVLSDHKDYYNKFKVVNYEFVSHTFYDNAATIVFNLMLSRNSDGKKFGFKIKSFINFNDLGKIDSVREILLDSW